MLKGKEEKCLNEDQYLAPIVQTFYMGSAAIVIKSTLTAVEAEKYQLQQLITTGASVRRSRLSIISYYKNLLT